MKALVALVLEHRVAGVGTGERTVVATLGVLGRGTGVQVAQLRGNSGRVGCGQRGNEEKNRLGAGEHIVVKVAVRYNWMTGLIGGFEMNVGLEE